MTKPLLPSLLVAGLAFSASAPARARNCTEVERNAERDRAISAPAADDNTAAITCDGIQLPRDRPVTRALIFEGAAASGVRFDCNEATIDGRGGGPGDMIEVRSVRSRDAAGTLRWDRPSDITIRNCNVFGAIRVWGMGKNGEAADLLPSSHRPGHTQRARDNAPTRIRFDNLVITAHGRTPFYVSPGASFVRLERSRITGTATSTAVYLDAESHANVLRDNDFSVTSRDWDGLRKREEIAIDGSSYNFIVNNRFSTLEGGGIFLYRNCGEDGVVRHAAPTHNRIINNVFYYDRYSGPNPSVYFGAREYKAYCPADLLIQLGSGADDRNYARYNVVMQNQIFRRPVGDMIRTGPWPLPGSPADPTCAPNQVALNQTVTPETVLAVGDTSRWPTGWSGGRIRPRRAGCWVERGYKNFVLDGQSLDVELGANGEPVCAIDRGTCRDGDWSLSRAAGCTIQRPAFGCRAVGSNEGCSQPAACPAGTRIVGAVAACNLEEGTISDVALARVRRGTIEVLRASDNVGEGRCFVGEVAVSSGRAELRGLADATSTTIGCREHDRNGGECQIRGVLYCR